MSLPMSRFNVKARRLDAGRPAKPVPQFLLAVDVTYGGDSCCAA